MAVYVFPHDADSFATTGLVGDLQPLECYFTEQKNGLSQLTMKLAYDDLGKWKAVQNGCKIKAPVPCRVPPVITPTYELAQTVKRYKVKERQQGQSERVSVYLKDKREIDFVERTYGVTPSWVSQIGGEVVIDGVTYVKVFVTESTTATTPKRNANIPEELLNQSNRNRYSRKGNVTGYVRQDELEDETEEEIPQVLTGLESVETPSRVAYQLFNVVSVEQTLDSISVSCEHVFYDLINNFTQWEPTASTQYKGYEACNAVLSNLASPDSRFTVQSDSMDTLPGSKIDVARKNGVEAFLDPSKGICALYGLNMIRNNYDIYLMKEVGSDRGFVAEYGKNLLGVQWKETIQNVVTRVFPFGHNENGDLIWISGATKYIDSTHINDYTVPLCEIYDTGLTIGQDGTTASNIQSKLVQEAQKRFSVDHADLPEVSMTINFVSLGDTEEYVQYRGLDKVYLFDIISIKDAVRGYQYSAQVIGIKHNVLTGMLESVTIGNVTNWSGTRKIARWQVPEISGDNIRLKSILAGAYADGSIMGDAIANGAIATVHLASATIDDLTTDALTAAYAQIHELIAGRITAEDISANAIEAQHIGAGVIEATHIGSGAVTTDKLYANAVTADKIGASAITTEKLMADAVTAAKIAAGAVNADKLAANSVTAAKISTDDLTAIQAKLQIADIANARIAVADIAFAQVKDLNAQSAYFGQAVIQEGVADKLLIPRLSVVYAQIVSATVSDLVIQATNDNFYKLDVDLDGNVTATQVTPSAAEIAQGHTTDGRTIYLGTDIVAEDLNTANIYASHALMDEITANIINVDKLFAREATISKINAMDLSSNTYIRSTVGNWQSQSTITQEINSLDSRISSLGYGTVYMQPNEPDHGELVSGDIWICTLADTTWQDIYSDFVTWQAIFEGVSTWQTLGGVPKMYVWDGRNWQLMYDAILPDTVESQIQQLQNEILLRVTQTDFDELSHEVSLFDARLTIQSQEIEAAVSAVNTKASSYVMLDDPQDEHSITLGDIWVRHDVHAETWESIYDYYPSWQSFYNAHETWGELFGDQTYVWDGAEWVLTSDRASEIDAQTKIEETAYQISLLASASALFREEIIQLDARITITAEQISQEVQRVNNDKISKTSQYQTADSIVTAAENYVDGQLTSYSTTTQTNSLISAYVTNNAYTIKSGVAITAAGVEISGGKYVKIKSGGSFTVDSGKFSIGTDGSVSIEGQVKALTGSIAGWTISASAITGNKTGIAKTTNDSDIAFWAGNASAGSAAFRVTQSGALTTTSGSIAGWEINSTSLRGNKTGLAKTTNDSDVAFWAGSSSPGSASFRVTQGGTLYASGAQITGTITGASISGGTISGSTITGGSLNVGSGRFSVDVNGNLSASNVSISGTVSGSTITGATVTGSSISGGTISGTTITGGSLNIGSGRFSVDSSGNLSASNVSISGTISGSTISGGTISGSTISGGSLNIGSGTFAVDSSGNLTATNATISGTIQSGSTISGASISGSSISGGSLNIGNGNFVVDSSGNVTMKSLNVANDDGTTSSINLEDQNSSYPLWKLSGSTIVSHTSTSMTLSSGEVINFNSAASVTLSGSWSGSTFTVTNNVNELKSAATVEFVNALSYIAARFFTSQDHTATMAVRDANRGNTVLTSTYDASALYNAVIGGVTATVGDWDSGVSVVTLSNDRTYNVSMPATAYWSEAWAGATVTVYCTVGGKTYSYVVYT